MGSKKKRGKDQSHGPETDAARHRQRAGQAEHAVAHLLRCRDTLDCRCKVHALMLVVPVGALRDDKPILERIVERREGMHSAVIGRLTPTEGRRRPRGTWQVELAQIKLHNRRAMFAKCADTRVLGHLCDR